jgi:molybdopterin synthase catalytic subunit
MAHLTFNPIDPAHLIAELQAPRRGAIATFLGVVRDHHEGRGVLELEYSAYEPMAEGVIAAVVAAAEAQWPVTIRAVHRVGRLAIGEIAIAVAVAGDHRDETFAACRQVVEEVKRRAPIWKRERYRDGREAWVDPTAEERLHPVAEGERR